MLKRIKTDGMTEDERERFIRERLGEQLGVEFATPDELASAAATDSPVEMIPTDTDTSRPPSLVRDGGVVMKRNEMSVSDLITQCNECARKMSVHNDHRMLLFNCALALRQLADRLWNAEHPQVN